jgi:hypothetical protein
VSLFCAYYFVNFETRPHARDAKVGISMDAKRKLRAMYLP